MVTRRSAAGLMAVLTAGWVVVVVGAQSAAVSSSAPAQPAASTAAAPAPAPAASQAAARPDHQITVRRYCVTCHNQRMKTAGLMLDTLDAEHPAASPAEWEKVIAKLRAGSMPPTGVPRPDAATYAEMIGWLEGELDRAWAASPNPGRIGAVHRLNRTRIQQRDARSVRAAAHRREVAAARRRNGRRQLRQLRRLAVDLDRAPGTLPLGGAPGHAARDRPAADGAGSVRSSRCRCTSCRTIGRARTCRSDRAAALRSTTTSRSTASTPSRSGCSVSIRTT